MSDEDIATIEYFAQRKWYHHILTACDTALKKRVGDPVLRFWRCVALTMDGKPTEAIRELETLQEKRDLALACPAAIIFAHQQCKHVDHEAVEELQARITIISSSGAVTERALLQSGLFHLYLGSPDTAKLHLSKAQELNSNSNAALASLGMYEINNSDPDVQKALALFGKVLARAPKDLGALVGRLRCLRLQGCQTSGALEVASQIIVHYPAFVPAHVERMYVLLEMSAWEQAVEASQKLLAQSPDNIDGLIMICLNEMCREGGSKMVVPYINSLNKALLGAEPYNSELYYTIARSFVRLANRTPAILEQCISLLERAIALNPASRNLAKAKQSYQQASSLDAHNIHALEGLIRFQLYSGDFDQAQEQLEIFNEIQTSMERSPEVAYLTSVYVWYTRRDAEKRLKYLQEAVSLQMRRIQSETLSLSYFYTVNPDFLLEIVRDYMEHCPSEPKREGEEPDKLLSTVHSLLEIVSKIVPGSTDAMFYMSKLKFLSGDKMGAQMAASNCLRIDNGYSKAHILMGQIQLSNNHPKLAMQSLEMGLSYNFEVRHIPLFHILKARALKMQGSYEEALAVLQAAMNLPGIKDFSKKGGKPTPQIRGSDTTATAAERVALYLELANTHVKLKNMHEAAKVMSDASFLFKGTPEQEAITVANATFALERGEIDSALGILATITSEQSHFIEARGIMADIYLKYKNDKKQYARCYSEIVEHSPTVESCMLLGDAYMNIQEPEQAIDVYESALESNPKSASLIGKIGRALYTTHKYSRAVSYYEAALAQNLPDAIGIQLELASLYTKLRQYKDAERIIAQALDRQKVDEISSASVDVKLCSMLGKVHKEGQDPNKAVSALSRARDLQMSIISKDVSAQGSKDLRQTASEICFELGDTYARLLKNSERASAYFHEAIQHNQENKKAMLALAKLYISKGDLTAAQNQCSNMLRMDVGNEEATMMIADIMLQKNSYSSAVFHFRQLLEKNPTNYSALLQLIEMMKRNGKLDEAEQFFELVQKHSSKASLHCGFHYCRGLYYRYSNNPNEALKEFNYCRRDAEWGERSLIHMIEIFLNPDNDTIGGDALESVADTNSSADKSETDNMISILTVDKLLKELPQSPKSLRTQILENYAGMATRQKPDIERALTGFTAILNVDKDNVSALLGMATAYLLQKQAPKARNQLKRIAKMEWNDELSDDFEKSLLLLADTYIQGGKFDLATELLKKVLSKNMSCAKAFEYMGYIMEKEASYKDAATHYELAWKLQRESSPAIGFKLAFNYLKAKRYVEAIDVCHKVLQAVPDYPKIRKEIMDKARASLRVP
ncbi:uncharacterized protein BJ171DRAFT_561472 [Polychytrium aggregatum]|uniref:uncharacterized protein n=1 Tax=Polychytrium aggregatum TaxID=110093 RepID=UPI0022FF1428|nr:uncharacterized protein BJ171DRAFT_561472 [Polychytrium aggregatum]KAI9207248.1 hypothetical protein BJ171DRAFT_561472 [Polychytrium aggregatum]